MALLLATACASAPGPAGDGPPARAGEPADPTLRLVLAVPPAELRGGLNSVAAVRRFAGALPAGASSATEVSLGPGTYVVKAGCGAGCDALRLRVEPAAGGAAAVADGGAYQAGLRLVVERAATYRVRVEVERCAGREACDFGFAVFEMA